MSNSTATPSTGFKRNLDIDIARAICIFLVVLGHSPYKTTTLEQWIYSFHMPFFFIISGVLAGFKTYEREWKISDFARDTYKKFRSLIIPYIVFAVLEQLLIICLHIVSGDFSISVDIIEGGLSILQCNLGVEWFLVCMFLASCIFWFCIRMKPCIGSIICVVAGLIGVLVPTQNPYLVILLRALVALCFMGVGFYTSTLWRKRLNPILFIIIVIVQIVLAMINPSVSLASRIFGNIVLYYINGVLGSYVMLQLSKYICLCKSKIVVKFSLLGRYSIVILCTHNMINEIIPPLINHSPLAGFFVSSGNAGGIILAVAICIVEVPVIWFCRRFLKPVFYFK